MPSNIVTNCQAQIKAPRACCFETPRCTPAPLQRGIGSLLHYEGLARTSGGETPRPKLGDSAMRQCSEVPKGRGVHCLSLARSVLIFICYGNQTESRSRTQVEPYQRRVPLLRRVLRACCITELELLVMFQVLLPIEPALIRRG